MKYTITIILLYCNQLIFAQNITPIWEARDTTDGQSEGYQLPKLLVDKENNIITVGETYAPGPVIGIYTTKRSSDGQILWTKYYDLPGQDFLKSAVTDSSGAVYVLVNTQNLLTNTTQFTILKYENGGGLEWQYFYSSDASVLTSGGDLLLTPEQDVIVVGSYNDIDPNEPAKGMLAVKLDAQMNEIWRTQYSNGGQEYGFGALRVAMAGDRMQIWGSHGAPQGFKFVSWQITNDGIPLGVHESVPYNEDYGGAYHVDRSGNLFIGDYVGEYKVTKYDTLANKCWTYKKPIIDRPNTVVDARLECIESDKSGNVYIGGIYNVDSIVGIMTKIVSKIDANGSLVWEDVYFGPDSILDISANKAGWLNDDLLLVTGVYVEDAALPNYQLHLDVYNKNGPYWSAKSVISGNKNNPTSILSVGSNFYISGTFTTPPTGTPRGYFLCKYPMSVVGSVRVLSEKIQAEKPRIIPNPAGDRFQLQFVSSRALENALLYIFDVQGKVIYSQKVDVNAGENNVEVSNFQFPSGKYVVSIQWGNRIFSGILIRQ